MDELPITAEQERQTRAETTELWERYRRMRFLKRLSRRAKDHDAFQQYRAQCRLTIRQLHAVIRQDWPEPVPTRDPYEGLTVIGDPLRLNKGWTPPASHNAGSPGKVTLPLFVNAREEARRYWLWLQRWQVGDVDILQYSWEDD